MSAPLRKHVKLTKEESEFASHVGLIGVDHVRNGDSHDDAHERLNGGGDGDGLGADLCGGGFTDNDEADGADGKIVDTVPDNLTEELVMQKWGSSRG